MQIIINRVGVIADDPRVIKKIKVRTLRLVLSVTSVGTYNCCSGELLSSSVLFKQLSSVSGSRRILFRLQAQCEHDRPDLEGKH